MEASRLSTVLRPYNPWWAGEETVARWHRSLPDFQRPIVGDVLADLRELPQIVSITGPRRVGKTTAVQQVISHLLRTQGIAPGRILYFSFDDPEIFASEETQRVVFDLLVEHRPDQAPVQYLFLDEVQRLPRWELFLKKYYDLKAPVRFVVSGSASSPIFRSSQESLLGRIKDRHLLPFSFREYCQYRLRERPAFTQTLEAHRTLRPALLEGDGARAVRCVQTLCAELQPFQTEINQAVTDYCLAGGFPEVWNLPSPIRKVLYEDLMMLTQYRKPENVLRFFVYLLAHPGQEVNMTKVAQEAGVERKLVEENLPRLEMTDLILRIQKFSHKPLRVRQGNIKCYPVDMALRNAVLRTWENPDAATMGLYAENLVIRELIGWPDKIEVAYFREKDREVDFVVTHRGNRYLPLEIKYREHLADLGGLRYFMNRYQLPLGVVITRNQATKFENGLAFIPLRYFLLVS